MSEYTITIVGAGVIGSSIGLAIKEEADPPRLLVHDKELKNAKAAVQLGAFDKAEWNLINACEKADLIILAIPLNGIRPTLEAIAPYLKEGAVISDTSPNKVPVLAWVKELLPEQVHYVGCNPIVHPTGSGYEHASADLFRNKLYCLTPAPSAHEQAVQLLVGVTGIIGAEAFFLDAVEHDGLVVAVEHLPALASITLLSTLAGQNSWREARKLAGKLFEQVSAGASGDPDAIKDTLLTDTDNLVHWLDGYIDQLSQLRTILADETRSEEEFVDMIDKLVVERQKWQQDYQEGRFNDPEIAPAEIGNQGLMRRLIN